MKNDLETADKGTRLGNYLIDSILFVIVFFILSIFLSILFPIVLEREILIIDSLPLILYFLYYFSFEYFFGTTPGKYLTKTIVTDYNGSKPGLKSVFIRSISRLIPFDIISYVFGLTGLHDVISKTLVVKRKQGAT